MFFDIGANIGEWSKANIHKCDKIIAVEAVPIIYNKLINNCKNNNNIVTINYAVANNNNKDIIFYYANCDVISTMNKDWLTSSSSRFYRQPYTQITCKSITIDSLIEQYGTPELIKIDVEGGEYDCISSLSQKVDTLCFEWASETNNISFKCIDYLYNLGFTKFYMQINDEYTFVPDNNAYYDINTIKEKLIYTIPKKDWGMIWCK